MKAFIPNPIYQLLCRLFEIRNDSLLILTILNLKIYYAGCVIGSSPSLAVNDSLSCISSSIELK